MAKIELPKFRYLCQDAEGGINIGVVKPYIAEENEDLGWTYPRKVFVYYYMIGKPNPNWKNTLIDLETDDYDYTDGILTRIKKK